MKLDQFNFPLSEHLIAVRPADPRDHSRLMVVSRTGNEVRHQRFFEVPQFLQKGDLLIVNTTKVKPVRFEARQGSRAFEVLLVGPSGGGWEAMIKPGKHLRMNEELEFPGRVTAMVSRNPGGEWVVNFSDPASLARLGESHGLMPVPPYILKRRKALPDAPWHDREWYQTMYAGEEGAIAAPTAGLHFTEQVMAGLKGKGVEIGEAVLHVGVGTFLPVRVEDIAQHRMLPERAVVSEALVERVTRVKRQGGRVIAVGTTVVRALESAAKSGELRPWDGPTELFIAPGFEFRVADGMVTNFHLPKSTPLVMVSAFAGLDRVKRWYEEAQREAYRWLSYGDAMLILP